MKKLVIASIATATLCAAPIAQGATVEIRVPERFRLLTDQLFDLRIEARDLANIGANLVVRINGKDVTQQLPAAEITTDNDANPASLDKTWTFRSVSFDTAGVATVEALVEGGAMATRIGVQDFKLKDKNKGKNIIVFIGDAMGTAYRDLGRIVAKSTDDRFREGFFDEWQEMDQMPVTGLVMTYAMDRIVPDSANTATAWATGNKTIDGAVGVFPDNDDHKFFNSAAPIQDRKQYALNNPRVETLWEFMKRKHGYKTGIVSTADIADATPAGQGGHSITRSLLKDITRQYVDGVFATGPAFDVILGGGKEHFISRTISNSGDTRNLANELVAAGYNFVETRGQLNSLPSTGASSGKLLGLFRTGNMNVAYDKLGLVRPADEPVPNFGGFTDQPFLEEMTAKAIATLSQKGGPFILMVEGASIDKQSHPNHAAGQIWDTIEMDKAIGVGRAFATGALKGNSDNKAGKTLVLVTADHDQSIHILGLVDTTVPGATQNIRNGVGFTGLVGEVDFFPDYQNMSNGYPSNSNRYRIAVGYRTGGHTGSSVPITAEGPGALLFTGYFDQTDVFFKMGRILSSETEAVDNFLKKKADLEIVGQNY